MSRHPVVITSLEEDFKALGLLSEGEMAPAPAGEPASNKTSNSRHVGAMTDDPEEEGEDPTDEMDGEPHQGAGPAKANVGAMPGAKSEAIRGMPDKYRATESDDEDEDDKDDKDDKDDDKEESVELVGSEAVLEAVSRLREGKSTGGSRKLSESSKPLDRVTSLIEDVADIMDSIADTRRSESVKAFANVSIIAEMLHRGFANFAESYEDEGLAEAADALRTLSEDAANVATAIEEGEDIDREALESEFRNEMDALISGLDLYADVVESDAEIAESELEEGEDSDDDDDDDKKDDEKDSDDDSEKGDKQEAGPRFKTPLIKAKGKGGTMRPSTGAGASMARLNMSKDEGLPAPQSKASKAEGGPRFRTPLIKGKKGGTMRPSTGAGSSMGRGSGGLVSSKTEDEQDTEEDYLPFGKGKPLVNRPEKTKAGI